MILLLRIILIRLLAGRKLQIALNLKGEVKLDSPEGPIYIGPGIKEVRLPEDGT